jgi:hypothetical protein
MRTAVITAVLLFVASGPAYSDESDVTSGSTQYFVSVSEQQDGSGGGSQSIGYGPDDPVVGTMETVACDSMRGDQTCAEPLRCDNGDVVVITTIVYESGRETDAGTNCPTDAVEEVATPTVTPGMVAAAFRRIPLPESELNVQPPNGRTLVNFDTL